MDDQLLLPIWPLEEAFLRHIEERSREQLGGPLRMHLRRRLWEPLQERTQGPWDSIQGLSDQLEENYP